MYNKKILKTFLLLFTLILSILFLAPKEYKNELEKSGINSFFVDQLKKSEVKTSESNNFDEYQKPIFLTIFKFVNNFIPSRK